MSAHFLRHEGYVGAMGALLLHSPPKVVKGFTEIFSEPRKYSGGFSEALGKLRELEVDLVPFPLLLNPENYKTDSIELLDEIERNELIKYFEEDTDKFLDPSLEKRIKNIDSYRKPASEFLSLFKERLKILRGEHTAFGEFSARRWAAYH